jgi:UDP-N-acetylglucosamine--N-acetylmuramyl-(pentapeptide) pyrophosphoryl-undecaprenol N-acetylglucosamine transferase
MLAGGGTGGHVFPGLALAEELRRVRPDIEVLFVGARGGIEESLVPEAGHRLELVRSVKVSGPLGYLRLPLALLAAIGAAGRLIDGFRPGALVALGGHAALAPALAARRRKLPVVVLEQNAIPGRVSRFLARGSREIHATYAESLERFALPTRVRVTGNPVRRSVLEAAVTRRKRIAGEKLNLLVAGGSQGARRLNEVFAEAAGCLTDLAGRLRVVQLAGGRHCRRAAEAAANCALEIEVLAFEKDMASRYAACDLAVSRAGATGLAELAVCGIPALLVPYPHAKDHHQEANARCFGEAGGALVFDERRLSGPDLAAAVRDLVTDEDRRQRMAERMRAEGRPRAGEVIAHRVVQIAAGEQGP